MSDPEEHSSSTLAEDTFSVADTLLPSSDDPAPTSSLPTSSCEVAAQSPMRAKRKSAGDDHLENEIPSKKAPSSSPVPATNAVSTPSTNVSPRKQIRGHARPGGKPVPLVSKPFKSPLMKQGAGSGSSASSSPAGARGVAKRGGETERLEQRVRLLRQAIKYKNDGSIERLPGLIETWRRAGRQAAEELWEKSGAASLSNDGFNSGNGPIGSSWGWDDPNDGAHNNTGGWNDSSVFPDSGGFEAQRRASGASDGRCDSPPPVEDLHQYAASVSRVPRYGAVRTLASANEEDQPGENEADEQESDEKEAKQEDWNIGKMLSMVGVDKAALGWNDEEGGFVD